MSFDVTTLALAKSYADQHGGGGGSGEKELFKIPVTVTELEEPADGEYFKVEHTVTLAELDAAVEEGKTPIVLADKGGVTYNVPLFYYVSGYYCFYAMTGGTAMYVVVRQPGDESETPKEVWQYTEDNQIINARDVYYHNSNNTSLDTAQKAFDKLLTDSHAHANKSVLDKFAETDGKPTYDGQALGGGAGDFIIKMTVETDDDVNYTVTSCDATFEQVDAAVAAGKRAVLFVSAGYAAFELPMLENIEGSVYYFGIFLNGYTVISFVQKIDESTSKWQFLMTHIQAESVSYSNAALPSVTNVRGALDALVPKSHSHDNKDALDKLSDANGKLQYNGSDVGLKGDKGDTPVKGTDYWTAADKAEIVNDTLAALPTWTGGNY